MADWRDSFSPDVLAQAADELQQERSGSTNSSFESMPSFEQALARYGNTPRLPSAPPAENKSLLGSGFNVGLQNALGFGGKGLQALGSAIGSEGIEQTGADFAQRRFQAAQDAGRSDMQKGFWEEGGPGFFPWLAYNAAQSVPYFGAALATAPLAEFAVPAGIAARAGWVGAQLPRFIGGGGLMGRTAASAAAEAEATALGTEFAKRAIAATPISAPVGAGILYNQMEEAAKAEGKEKPTQAQAAAALALGIPYGLLEAVGPAQLGTLAKKGLSSGNILKRIGATSFAEGAQETVTGGVQAFMESALRPDLTFREKVNNIVEGALTEGAVGAVFGAPAGIRRLKTANPANITKDDLSQATDEVLGLAPNAQQTSFDLGPEQQAQPSPVESIVSAAASPTYTDLAQRAANNEIDAQDPNVLEAIKGAEQEDSLIKARTLQDLERRIKNGEDIPGGMEAVNALRSVLESRGQEGLFAQQRQAFAPQQQAQQEATQSAFDLPVEPKQTTLPTIKQGSESYSSLLKDVPTSKIVNKVAELQSKLSENTATPQDSLVLEKYKEVLAQRQEDSRLQEKAVRDKAKELVSDIRGSGQALAKIQAQDEVDLARQVQEKLTQGSANPTFLKLGEVYQLSNPNSPMSQAIAERQAAQQAQGTQAAFNFYDETPPQGGPNAVQERGPTEVPVQPAPDVGREVVQGVSQPAQAPSAGQAQAPLQEQAQEQQINFNPAEPVANIKEAPVPALTQRLDFINQQREQIQQKAAATKNTKLQDQYLSDEGALVTEAKQIQKELQFRAENPQTQQTQQTEASQSFGSQGEYSTPDAFERFLGKATSEKLKSHVEFLKTQRDAALKTLKNFTENINRQIDFIKAGKEKGNISAKAAAQKIKELEAKSNAAVLNYLDRNVSPWLKRIQAVEDELQRRGEQTQTERTTPKAQNKTEQKQSKETAAQQKQAVNKLSDVTVGPSVERSGAIGKQLKNILAKWSKLLRLANTKILLLTEKDLLDNKLGFKKVPALQAIAKKFAADPSQNGLMAYLPQEKDGTHLGIIILNSKLLETGSSKINPFGKLRLFETLAHEMGHLHLEVVLARAPKEIQDRLLELHKQATQKYREKYAKGKGPSYNDLLKEIGMYVYWQDSKNLFKDEINKPFAKAIPLKDDREYLLDFQEWFANQVARWALTSEKPLNAVEEFLVSIGKTLKKFFKEIKIAGFLPDTTFKQYIEDLSSLKLSKEPTLKLPDYSKPASFRELRVVPIKNTQDLFDKTPKTIQNLVKQIDAWRTDFKGTAREYALWSQTLGGLDEWNRKYFKGTITSLRKGYDTLAAVDRRISQLALIPYNKLLQAAKTSDTVEKLIGILMSASGYRLNPNISFEQHTWLKDAPNKDDLAALHAKMVQARNQLRQSGNFGIYEDLISVNKLMQLIPQTLILYNMIQKDPQAKAAFANLKSPWEEFIRDDKAQLTPKGAQDFWKAKFDQLYKDAVEYRKNVETKPAQDKSRRILPAMAQQLAQMSRAEKEDFYPYFHLARFGEWFVSFSVRKDGKIADPKALERVAQILKENGFENLATVSSDQTNPSIYIRLETEAQKESLLTLVRTQMAKEGLLDEKVKPAGDRRNVEADYKGLNKKGINELVNFLQSTRDDEELANLDPAVSAALKERDKQFIADVMSFYRDSLPELSSERVLTQRKFVGGWSPDMVRGYMFRTKVGAQMISNLVALPQINDSFIEMRKIVKEARTDQDDVGGAKSAAIGRIYQELATREHLRPARFKPSFVDRLRAYTNLYFLSMSVSYGATNLMSIPVLLYPELLRDTNLSYRKAAQIIFRVTPTAFKILRAAWTLERERGRGAEVVLSPEALQAAGLDAKTAQFMIYMVNTNALDIGGATREHSQIVEGDINSKERKLLQWAGVVGYQTEAFNRIVAALAAKEAYNPKTAKGLSLEDFARNVLSNSMLNFAESNVARALGRNGVFGNTTRLSATFMQYPTQVFERLIRESYRAIISDSSLTDQDRKEARRYLAAHSTMLLAFAGVAGLPIAGAVATAINSLADLFGDDDEPYDVMTSLESFFSDLFGEEAAPYIMRGAIPRLAGMDVSQRIGEGDLFPFTKFMQDRRDIMTKVKDQAFGTFGAPFSMIGNIADGMYKVAQGDIYGGIETGMPVAFRSLFKAYRYGTEGKFTDRSGNALPITPGALDKLNQALGFKPAQLEDYQRQDRADTNRRFSMQRQASQLRKDAYNAIESGDRDASLEALRAIRDWDQRNPAFAIGPTLEKSLKQRARARRLSEITGAPLNTPQRELLYYYLPRLTGQGP